MRLALHWQIIIAIILAVVVGITVDNETQVFSVNCFSIFDFFGEIFLNALKMLIVPLVMASIICGVSSMGEVDKLGKLGAKVFTFYMLSSLAAILTGLLMVNILSPGLVDGQPLQLSSIKNDSEVAQSLAKIEGKGADDIVDVFVRMVPPNIVKAASEGQMLGLIFFSLLFGFFMTKLEGESKNTLLQFWRGVQDVMMMITLFVMKFAPIGVFGLVAKTIAVTGFEAFSALAWFFVTVALALFIHMFITMTSALKLIGGVSPVKHIKAMSHALLTAFSTASSSATLPLTIECIEKNAGVSNRTAAFVLPLGATVNMDGTALYECVAAMFIAQVYGLELSIVTQFTIVLMALLTSIGVAGIPAASLVAISVILTAVGLPLEGIGLLLVTDRVLDMLRTAVNVFSDSCCAVIIARNEGEQTMLI
jgi:Na+/H+-dicarboxylate symporter